MYIYIKFIHKYKLVVSKLMFFYIINIISNIQLIIYYINININKNDTI
jgi:hypothetical protein